MPALTALTLLWFACLPAPSQGPSAAERLTLAPPTLNEVNEAQAVITVTLRLGSASDPTGKEGLSALLAAMITADANTRILGLSGYNTGSIAAICSGDQSARNNSHTLSRNGPWSRRRAGATCLGATSLPCCLTMGPLRAVLHPVPSTTPARG